MTHPHQLHAAAALWSLTAAAAYLAEHRETVLIRRPQLGPATTRPRTLTQLQQWDQLLREERAERAAGSLRGLKPSGANPTPLPPGLLDLDVAINTAIGDAGGLLRDCQPQHPRWADHPRVLAAFPRLVALACGSIWAARIWLLDDAISDASPAVAREVAAILQPVDERVRAVCGVGPDHWALPLSPPCPTCRERRIRVQTSAADSRRWTVVCANDGCRCLGDGQERAGDGCPCGMPTRAAGVRHIWAADSPLAVSAFAGATLAGGKAAA